MPDPHARPRRRRRSAEEAREHILAAAQRRLAADGPDGVRLQDVAADAGLSHPAILHHFGSRAGLMGALEARAMRQLVDDLLAPGRLEADGLDRVARTLGEEGHARLLAWWALKAGEDEPFPADVGPVLRELAVALQETRAAEAQASGRAVPDPDDAVFAVRLAAAAMLGEALLGRALSRSAGLADHEDASRRFRAWLGELLARGAP